MWIRSQDRLFLTEVQTVAYHRSYGYVDEHTPNKILHELRNYSEYFLDETGRVIGTFDTKKDALAELDYIERWISAGAGYVYQVSKP